LSAIAKYYDRTIELCGKGSVAPRLLERIDCMSTLAVDQLGELPDLRCETAKRTLIVIDGAQDVDWMVKPLLAELLPVVGRTTRVAIVGRRITSEAKWLDG
jgi:hypothetical protein